MKTANTVSCLKFDEQELKIMVVDLLTQKVIWRKAFTYDFEVFDNAGIISNPGQLTSFIQTIFHEHGLPARVRVSLNLEYLNLTTLMLPTISGPEFHQIIVDEAYHQSVFSFMNEEVAVVYQIIKDKINQNGVFHSEIFTVTTLRKAIGQIVAVFNTADFVLELISPSVRGLKEYLNQTSIDLRKPLLIVLVGAAETEVYIWEGQTPRSGHFIKTAPTELAKLQNEVRIALDYFNKQASDEERITQAIIIGEESKLNLGTEITVKNLAEEVWPDLFGLALITKDFQFLNFLKPTEHGLPSKSSTIIRFWPILMGSLFILNFMAAWNMSFGNQRLVFMKQQYQNLTNDLRAKQQQLGLNNQTNGVRLKVHTILENLSETVTEDMMFDKLSLDIVTKSIEIQGFALSQKNLSSFLKSLSEMKAVKSVEEIESTQQNRVDLTGYAFRFRVTFGEELTHD